MTIKLQHASGLTQHVPSGFSWTCFFFGALVPLIRGDLFTAGWTVLLCVVTAGVAAPFIWLYLAFAYNKQFLKAQLEKGWQFASLVDQQLASR